MRSQSNKASAGRWLADGRQTGAMTQQIATGQVSFSGLREVGPVFCDWCIEIQLPNRDQLMSTNSHETFGSGIDIDQGLFSPGPGAFFVPITAPKVDHGSAVDYNGDCGANFSLLVEIVHKRVTNRGKPGVALSFDP